MILNLIIWIVIGFIAGYLAKLIMPGPDGGGFILTTILGIVGAFVGGFVGRALHIGGESINDNDFSLWSLILAVIGAIVVLAVYRLITGRSERG